LELCRFYNFCFFYRSLFGTIGSYLTAKFSPNRPMFHSIIGGIIGFVTATTGAIAMRDKPPHWYSIALIITTLPFAWLGGQIFINMTNAKRQ
ncbi:MAG TPA: hypothetical protein VN958_21195, partial [Chitinophagaceae bacterium]|nr:hypothetical protein [Chitinophagaceae bacterium]